MENASYTTLTRQVGLLREMSIIANNIANSSTSGFRQEGLTFSEHIERSSGGPSLSMAVGNIQHSSLQQGALTPTGGQFDVALEGAGFFLVETPDGNRLTRSGNFTTNSDAELVTMDGRRVLDTSQSGIFIPPDATGIEISRDGTIGANGNFIAQLGVFQVENASELVREGGVLFRAEEEPVPNLDAKVVHGFLEQSNVDPVSQLARMIEVQRAYEMGQSFLDAENERVRGALQTMIR